MSLWKVTANKDDPAACSLDKLAHLRPSMLVSISQIRVAQAVQHLSAALEVTGSNPTMFSSLDCGENGITCWSPGQ